MSLRVLVVDDEPIVRLGLRTVVPWEELGFQIAGEASNGLDGLNLAEELKPDVIVADILMPGMDGFEFIQRVRKILPDCRVIVLSCRDNIESYKEAIRLNVSAYIQKNTIEAQELTDVLTAVRKEYLSKYGELKKNVPTREIANRQLVMNDLFNSIIDGRINEPKGITQRLEDLELIFIHGNFYFVLLKPEKQAPSDSLTGLCGEIVEDAGKGCVFEGAGNYLSILLAVPSREEDMQFLEYFCGRIKDTIEQVFDFSVDVGVSGIQRYWTGVREGYRDALIALDQAYVKGETGIHFFKLRPTEIGLSEMVLEAKARIMEISSLPELINAERFLEQAKNTFRTQPFLPPVQIRAFYLDILYHFTQIIAHYDADMQTITGTEFNPILFVETPKSLIDLHGKFTWLLKLIADYDTHGFPDIKMKISFRVESYISDHVKEKISLKSLADYVNLSPSYVSRVYKEVKGINIKDKIHEEKITVSIPMLRTGMSLESVAETMDFSSLSHYIRVFKAVTGKTPGHFMKGLRQIENPGVFEQ